MRHHNHHYEFIHRNVEAVQSEADRPPVNKERDLKSIENGMIDDTLSLIDVLDGSQAQSDTLLSGERESHEPFDAAVYLDKSGRPVRQLVHELWSEGSDKPEPKSLFLNIDKRPWLQAMGFRDDEVTNLEDIKPDDISLDRIDPEYLHRELSALRALYLRPSDFENIDESNLEDVWSKPTRLDGKTIAIIDEVKSSGNTLRIAMALLQRAVPEAHFEGMWWSNPGTVTWQGGADVNDKRQFAVRHVPPWYDAKRESGRGIGDIDIPHSLRSPSKAQRIGKSILSRPEIDDQGRNVSHRTLSASVRRDISKLADRFKQEQLVDYRPNPSLDDDSYDRRLERYYKLPADVVLKKWRDENAKKKR